MGAGWVAATVRAKAMARRRIGAGAARRIAGSPNLSDALGLLRGTAYTKASAPGTSLPAAERLVAAAELWQLRVLAGWLPRSAVGLARALGARYERANIETHARSLAEPGRSGQYYDLGSLALSWPRIAVTTSPQALREALAASPWGDPGDGTVEALHDVLALRWLRMIAAEAAPTIEWVTGAAALLVAKQLLVTTTGPADWLVRAAAPLVGTNWVRAGSVSALREAIPVAGRWVLEGVDAPSGLWRAETGLAVRIESDGFRLLRHGTPDVEPFLGAIAVLAVDGWRVRVALGDAALGAGPGRCSMSWRDAVRPVRMQRIGLVVPAEQSRELLARLDAAGVVDLDPVQPEVELAVAAEREPGWSARETEFRRRTAQAVAHGPVTAWLGWTPSAAMPGLTSEVASIGGAAVPLSQPPGIQPPTLLRQQGRGQSFELLVQTYTTVPYADVDPSLVAGIVYVAMFGMMFGDVGHGLLLLIGAAIVRSGRFARLAKIRRAWPFLAGAGAMSVVFGFLYGEMFGPTGLVPVLWLSPIDAVTTLLLTAIGVGAVLLGGAYALGIVNRFREGGWGFALYARTGIAGSLLFLALGGVVAGIYFDIGGILLAAVLVAIAGLVLTFVGLLAVAGGGSAGVLQAVVELFDVVVRLGSNVVSFARLAAFGLTHAALGAIVWLGATALWGGGSPVGRLGAVLVLLIGTAVAFALEALVAGIQALRLEYYELFSRVFESDGRPFRPWRLPAEDMEVTP